MTKMATEATVPPLSLGTGKPVHFEDAQAAAEILNYAAGENPHSFISIKSGDSGWGSSGNEVFTHEVFFPISSGYTRRYIGSLWVDDDAQNIRCSATVTMPASNTGRVRITVGSANVVLTGFTSGATTTVEGSALATSSTGTGWLVVTVEVDHQTGSSPSVILEDWRIAEQAISATSLPDPANA